MYTYNQEMRCRFIQNEKETHLSCSALISLLFITRIHFLFYFTPIFILCFILLHCDSVCAPVSLFSFNSAQYDIHCFHNDCLNRNRCCCFFYTPTQEGWKGKTNKGEKKEIERSDRDKPIFQLFLSLSFNKMNEQTQYSCDK